MKKEGLRSQWLDWIIALLSTNAGALDALLKMPEKK